MTAAYCNHCGGKLNPNRAPRDHRGRAKLHADLAHPINSACRIELHRAVVKAFAEELERSELNDYEPVCFDDLDDVGDLLDESYLTELTRRQEARKEAKDVVGEKEAEHGA